MQNLKLKSELVKAHNWNEILAEIQTKLISSGAKPLKNYEEKRRHNDR